MRKILPLLALLILAACGGDAGTAPIDPADMRLVKVSGDNQEASVAASAGASNALSAKAAADGHNLLPEPLVARITGDGAGNFSLSPVGPSFSGVGQPSFAEVALPANTIVTFRVVDPGLDDGDDRTCGASFLDSGIPDDSAFVTTFWEKGTYAADCAMQARLVVDGQPIVDATWHATFTPGPLVGWRVGPKTGPGYWISVSVGDTVRLDTLPVTGRDEHFNDIPASTLAELPIEWTWQPWTDAWPKEVPTDAGNGWTVVIPEEALDWGNDAGLVGWLGGVRGGFLFDVSP